MTDTRPDDVIAQLRRLDANLPERVPSTLHVGPYVLEILQQADAKPWHAPRLPALPIVTDPDCRPGQWRILDQHGEQMAAGNLWPPHLPVRESSLLPEGTIAVVYTPPDGYPFAGEPCVIVREAPLPRNAQP